MAIVVGAFGFRVNGKDKITSAEQVDGQPRQLGIAVFEFIEPRESYQLKAIAEKIEFVNANDKPYPIHVGELLEQIMNLQDQEDKRWMKPMLDGLEKFMEQIAPDIPFQNMSLEEEIEDFDADVDDEESSKTDEGLSQALKEQYANIPGPYNFTWLDFLPGLQAHTIPRSVGFRYVIDRHELLADSLTCKWAYIINVDEECLEIYTGENVDPNARGRYASLETGEWQGVALILTLDFERCTQMTKEDFISIVEEKAHEYLDTHRA